MSSSFDLESVDHLTTGTVGPPGERVFFLQARAGEMVVSLQLEKTQVAALIRYLGTMLADLPPLGELPTEMNVDELVEEDEEGARARIAATREQVAALAIHGAKVVAAGRPPCPLCGQPLDPRGHMCARLNGHRRL